MKTRRNITSAVFLGAILSAQATLSGQTPTPTPAGAAAAPHYYSYFKEHVSLSLDATRIAFHQPIADGAVAAVPDLKAFDIAPEGVSAGPITGWSFAKSPDAAQGDEGLRRLIREMAAAPAIVDFVSPVFLDEYGPVIITPELLVGFNDDVSAERATTILQQAGAGTITEANYSRMHNVYRIRSASRNGFEVLQTANALAEHPDVKFAESNMIRTAKLHSVLPNDPVFPRQWHLHNTGQNIFQGLAQLCCSVPCTGDCFPGCPDPCIPLFGLPCDQFPGGLSDFDLDAPEAWNVTIGDPSVIIAVFDMGIHANLADLPIDPALAQDFTGTGGGGFAVEPCDFHGTAVAGTIGALLNNGIGVAGLAPGCRVASARIFYQPVTTNPCMPQNLPFQPSWLIDALHWAQSIGAQIANHSYAIGQDAAVTQKFAETHAAGAGMMHFSGSGNSGVNSVLYPARLPSVYAVSGLEMYGARWAHSNYGNEIEFSAPANLIYTVDSPGDLNIGYYGESECNDYVPGIGTSFASPLAAGVAGLILSVHPSLSADQVAQIMRDSAVDRGAPGWDSEYGWGFVNAFNAVTLAQLIPGDMNCDGAVTVGDIAGFVLALTDPTSYAAQYPSCTIENGDINGDGAVTVGDISGFVALLTG